MSLCLANVNLGIGHMPGTSASKRGTKLLRTDIVEVFLAERIELFPAKLDTAGSDFTGRVRF